MVDVINELKFCLLSRAQLTARRRLPERMTTWEAHLPSVLPHAQPRCLTTPVLPSLLGYRHVSQGQLHQSNASVAHRRSCATFGSAEIARDPLAITARIRSVTVKCMIAANGDC